MSDYAELLLQKTEALRAPIAGGSPGGSDASFDPVFEKLKGEIDKLSGLDGAQPDWRSVNELAADVLSTKAKDFRAATWLATARLQTSGWQGLAEGLAVMHALASEYWDTMFPEARRARARANLVGWMVERIVPKLQEIPVRMQDGDAVRRCSDLFEEIDSILAEKVGDAYGGLGELRSVMRSRVRDIPEPPPPVVETPAAETSSSESTSVETSGGGAMPAVSSPEEVDDALLAHGASIMAAARVLREADAASADAYRLMRAGAFLPLRIVPPNEGGTTWVPAPDPYYPGTCEGHAASGSWMELLATAEEGLGTSFFWLDAHRWTATALDRLGPAYAAAREAVGREVVAFLARMPGVEHLSFSDGTPFAQPATRSWLEEETARWGGGGGGKPNAANAEDEELAARLEEAKALVQAGRVGEGLSLANALANRSPDIRRRFRARTGVAQMALDAGRAEIARAMFDGLAAEIERHGLELWEPDLCAPVFRGVIDCIAQLGGDETTFALRATLFEKLCRIDPGAAFTIATAGES